MREAYENMGDVYGKWRVGAALTDKEVEDGLAFFTDLADKLDVLGPRFFFAFREANTMKEHMLGFKLQCKL
jgi:hypothetical protein